MKQRVVIIAALLMLMLGSLATQNQRITGTVILENAETMLMVDKSAESMIVTVIPGIEGSGNLVKFSTQARSMQVRLACRNRCTAPAKAEIKRSDLLENLKRRDIKVSVVDYNALRIKEYSFSL